MNILRIDYVLYVQLYTKKLAEFVFSRTNKLTSIDIREKIQGDRLIPIYAK